LKRKGEKSSLFLTEASNVKKSKELIGLLDRSSIAKQSINRTEL